MLLMIYIVISREITTNMKKKKKKTKKKSEANKLFYTKNRQIYSDKKSRTRQVFIKQKKSMLW